MSIVTLYRHSRFIAWLLIFSLIDLGCAPVSKIFSSRGKAYRYSFEMTEPAASKELTYKVPEFTIWFVIDQGAINYTLRNTTGSRISILAGNASIGIGNKFSPVRTSTSYYVDTVSYLVSNNVLANGNVRDFFIPRENVYYTDNKWIEKPLLTIKDEGNPAKRQAIQKNVGSEISLLLPIKVGNNTNDYTFKFKIASVKNIEFDSLRSMPRIPVPQMPKKPPTNLELWSSIGIVSSVILFSIFLVTREKPFPGGL